MLYYFKTLKDSGAVSPAEFSLLDRYFSMVFGKIWSIITLDRIVYIESDPSKLLNRIGRRGRKVVLAKVSVFTSFIVFLRRRYI